MASEEAMNNKSAKVKTFLLLSIIILLITAIATSTKVHSTESIGHENPIIHQGNTSVPNIEPTSTPVSTETPYPTPLYIPTLRPYETKVLSGLILASNSSGYITPNNEWVKYYASQLFIDTDGKIRYKNEKVISAVDINGIPLSYYNKPFINNYDYSIYQESFGYVDKNNIPWLMPDYYLSHGQRGVCSAWANTVTSMMLSGEMSLKDGGNIVKQVIPAKSVMGYSNGIIGENIDVWVEYQVYGTTWITTTGINQDMGNPVTSVTFFMPKDNKRFIGIFEFTDKYFKSVDKN